MTEDRDTLHVLQVTDCHLMTDPGATVLGVCTRASLAVVLDTALAERTPDAVLATGDIAQEPTAATYGLFLSTLANRFPGPLLCVPGNHDHGETFAAHLPTADLALPGWRLVGVDTHVDDVVGGHVEADELARLGAVLAAGDDPVLVAGHHCPVAFGCSWLDAHRIDNGGDLVHLLNAAGTTAYVFGHIHQEVAINAALPLYGTPSTCFQFATDTPSFAIDAARPGYRWLELGADGSVATRVGRADFHWQA